MTTEPAWDHYRTFLSLTTDEPQTRFAGEAGEQSTFFVADPSGNALEFKSFADDAQVFAK